MIKINSGKNVLIVYNDIVYNVTNKSDYNKFVLLITDPVVDFDNTQLVIDDSITDDKDKAIINKYIDFLNSFLVEKNKIKIEIENTSK